jgi:hypothetical protein
VKRNRSATASSLASSAAQATTTATAAVSVDSLDPVQMAAAAAVLPPTEPSPIDWQKELREMLTIVTELLMQEDSKHHASSECRGGNEKENQENL